MFHFCLYEIKNNLNGKIYVGVHKTKNLDDGYMGSGTLIGRAIKSMGLITSLRLFSRSSMIPSQCMLEKKNT